MGKFRCPNCGSKIPMKELLNFKKSHQTKCERCQANLKPKKIKSWNFGFGLGFLAVAVPVKIYWYYNRDFLVGMFLGLFCGILFITLFILYLYKVTEFEEI